MTSTTDAVVRTAILALLLGTPGANVRAACPLPDLGNLQALGQDGREAALQRLDAAEPLCKTDAEYYALRGALLHHQRRHLDAARDLEHAILLQPRHGGALIDYALTLAALGDRAGARAIVAGLRRERGLPPSVAAILEELDARLAPPLPEPDPEPASASASVPPGSGRWRVTLLGGYSSNRNAAPSASSLTFTFPGAEVELPLAPESRPNPGPLGVLAVDYMPPSLTLDGGASLALLAQVRLRAPPDGLDGRLSYARLEAVHARRASARLNLAGIALEALDAVSGGTRFGLDVYAERRWPGDNCSPAARISLLAQNWSDTGTAVAEGRGVLGVPYLDGIQPRLTGRLACGPTEWSAYVGRLLVPDGRAGGDTDQFGLRLTHRWALPRGTLDLFANAAYFADHESYSPLLSRGAPRKMLALDLGLEWEHSLGQGWSWVTRVESYDQRSNLDLFGVRQTGVYLGLRWDGVR